MLSDARFHSGNTTGNGLWRTPFCQLTVWKRESFLVKSPRMLDEKQLCNNLTPQADLEETGLLPSWLNIHLNLMLVLETVPERMN